MFFWYFSFSVPRRDFRLVRSVVRGKVQRVLLCRQWVRVFVNRFLFKGDVIKVTGRVSFRKSVSREYLENSLAYLLDYVGCDVIRLKAWCRSSLSRPVRREPRVYRFDRPLGGGYDGGGDDMVDDLADVIASDTGGPVDVYGGDGELVSIVTPQSN